MIVMSTSTVSHRCGIKGISHEIKNGYLILTLCGLIDVSYICSMVLIMVNLHGGSINIRLKSFECIRKVRNKVRVGSNRRSNSSGEGSSLFKYIATTGTSI